MLRQGPPPLRSGPSGSYFHQRFWRPDWVMSPGSWGSMKRHLLRFGQRSGSGLSGDPLFTPDHARTVICYTGQRGEARYLGLLRTHEVAGAGEEQRRIADLWTDSRDMAFQLMAGASCEVRPKLCPLRRSELLVYRSCGLSWSAFRSSQTLISAVLLVSRLAKTGRPRGGSDFRLRAEQRESRPAKAIRIAALRP